MNNERGPKMSTSLTFGCTAAPVLAQGGKERRNEPAGLRSSRRNFDTLKWRRGTERDKYSEYELM